MSAHRLSQTPLETIRIKFINILLLPLYFTILLRDIPAQEQFRYDPGTNLTQVVRWSDLTMTEGWILDAVGNPARLEQKLLQGGETAPMLAVTPLSWNQDHVRLLRAVRWELKGITAITIDVYDELGDGWIALGFKNESETEYAETARVDLDQGWNNDVAISPKLINFGDDGSKAATDRSAGELGRLTQLYILLGRDGQRPGRFALANMRFVGAPAEAIFSTTPEIASVTADSDSVPAYGLLELSMPVTGKFASYFDPAAMKIEAEFSGPGGGAKRVMGFHSGLARTQTGAAATWKVRFTPTEPGQWSYRVWASSPEGRSKEFTGGFHCTPANNPARFIRRSRADPVYFEKDSNEFFFPVGMNVSWASDYEYYFAKMHDSGINWARIWFCPWNLWLEPKLGQYDLSVADRFDTILRLADKYDIYLQLVFEYHGMLSAESWPKNPYNSINEGPCATEGDFFINADARRAFKNRASYIISRWGHSPRIFAWELFNEIDLARYDRVADLVAWHNELASYIRSVDPYGHLITTSGYSEKTLADVWKLDGIDFVQAHGYLDDIDKKIEDVYAEAIKYGKPFLMSEFGKSTKAVPSWDDRDGHHLHEALWTAYLLPASGGAMPWWWDSLVDANNLYRLWKAFSLIGCDIDRRNGKWYPLHMPVPLGNGRELRLKALLSNQACLIWIGPSNDAKEQLRRIPPGLRLRFSNMLDGPYEAKWINPWNGEVVSTATVSVVNTELRLEIPASDDSIVCRVVRQTQAIPYVSPEATP